MARVVESITGHRAEIEKLFRIRESGRWPHAMLFAGPTGIGKKKVAVAMAQALVCGESKRACGVCGPCLRIEKLQSESLTIVTPDASLVRPAIKVEQIRDLLDSLSLAALGPARVIIIDQADTMNAQASNALLKTLEEPTENVYFILIGKDVQQFLPTIRSRTQALRFSALSYEEIKLVHPGLPDWTYRSSRGQTDRLAQLSTPEGTLRREEALTFLEQFCQDENFMNDKNWRDSVKDRAWALFSLNCWLLLARDAVVLKAQAQKYILNTDQAARLKELYEVSSSKLLWLAQKLVAAEKDINANADPVLVFENLWIQYARVD